MPRASGTEGGATPRIKDRFIEGDTDFIFGRAVMVIDGGTIRFLAIRVHFTAESGAPLNKISLGRSWDHSSTTPTPNGQAVVREPVLGAHISQTAPWAAAATSGRAFSAPGNRFDEFCNSGPGSDP